MTIASITVRFNGVELMGYYVRKGDVNVYQFVMGKECLEFGSLKEVMDHWNEAH